MPMHGLRPVVVVALAIILAGGGAAVRAYLSRGVLTPLGSAVLTKPTLPQPESTPDSPFRFELMSPDSGVDFTCFGGPSPNKYMTEQNGGGVGLLDYDNDGMPDLFLVNGSDLQEQVVELERSSRLYRAVGEFQFVDATEESGLLSFTAGMGCAAGDFNNDGFVDLFMTVYGQDRLWCNNGDGTFTNVTDEAGISGTEWGTGAAFADLDGDGLLDLYVVNYVEWSADDPPCHSSAMREIRTVCSPMHRPGQADALYHNLGNGSFREVGAAAGIGLAEQGKGLALSIADFNADGNLDVYVVNDTTRNFLFQNQGGLHFQEVGILQGVAMSNNGRFGSGMGVGCADYDQNGFLDLCVTNFQHQVNDLYANQGDAGFSVTNSLTGLDFASRSPLGFGVVMADFDLDTWPDMFVANGHINDLTSIEPQNEYRMTPQVLMNRSGRRFIDVSKNSGAWFSERLVGRAVACGDLDGDADPDLVVADAEVAPALLRNDSDRAGRALRLQFIGTTASRQPLGARVELTAGQTTFVSHVPSGGSFQASHDPVVVLALPDDATEVSVRIHWAGDAVESWTVPDLEMIDTLRLVQGTGRISGPSWK